MRRGSGRAASAFHSALYFGVDARIVSRWPQKLRLSSICANSAPTFGSLPAESSDSRSSAQASVLRSTN